MSRRIGSTGISPNAMKNSTISREPRSPSSSPPRLSEATAAEYATPSPRLSFGARPMETTPKFAPADRKHRRTDEAAAEGTNESPRRTRRSTNPRPSSVMISRRVSAAHEGESDGFFHDLRALQPLRLRLGVCALPDTGAGPSTPQSPAVTALLLSPRKFLTLPKEKGGSDVIGWAAVFSSVSIELPSEGIYNKASVSASVMLPP